MVFLKITNFYLNYIHQLEFPVRMLDVCISECVCVWPKYKLKKEKEHLTKRTTGLGPFQNHELSMVRGIDFIYNFKKMFPLCYIVTLSITVAKYEENTYLLLLYTCHTYQIMDQLCRLNYALSSLFSFRKKK